MSNQIVPYNGDSRQPQKFTFDNHDINIEYDADGNPAFYGPDVCRALELSTPSRAYDRLDDDEKVNVTNTHIEHAVSGRAPVWVNESGLYSLIMQSRKPAAKSFKKWITSEVLPAIRKSGSYSLKSLTPAEMILVQAQQLVEHERRLAELQEQTAQNTIQIEDIHDELLDRDYYTVLQWCQRQHIQHTPSLRQMWGKAAKAESLVRNIEIKDTNEGMYNVGRYHKSILLDVCIPKPKSNGQLPLLKR
jgi:prophage antirepressor-like protein